VSRPLLAALVWAALTWSLQPALNAGVFFELLWLDLFPAGTYIPPHGLLSLTACLSLLSCLPAADMRTTALVLIVTLPLAYLGAWVEQAYRTRQNLSYNQLITWNRRGFGHAYTPERLVFRAMAELFVLYFLLHLACVLVLLPVLRLVQPWLVHGLQPTWPLFWAAAIIGAILALRLPRVYALTGAALALGAVSTL
jgi:PTS system mannose-specific IIC component